MSRYFYIGRLGINELSQFISCILKYFLANKINIFKPTSILQWASPGLYLRSRPRSQLELNIQVLAGKSWELPGQSNLAQSDEGGKNQDKV